MTSLILRINNTNVDQAYPTGTYVTVNLEDYFIFSGGSDEVDNDITPLPTELDLNRAAVLLDPLGVIVPRYFLADVDPGILKEVKLAGNQNKQYVFCCSFDGATATEPRLEAWDDENLNSILSVCLGGGTPILSWYRAICTTNDLPGVNWTTSGIPLAGSGVLNSLLLNDGDGALTIAKNLYFNFQISIPGSVVTPAVYTPALLITYTTN